MGGAALLTGGAALASDTLSSESFSGSSYTGSSYTGSSYTGSSYTGSGYTDQGYAGGGKRENVQVYSAQTSGDKSPIILKKDDSVKLSNEKNQIYLFKGITGSDGKIYATHIAKQGAVPFQFIKLPWKHDNDQIKWLPYKAQGDLKIQYTTSGSKGKSILFGGTHTINGTDIVDKQTQQQKPHTHMYVVRVIRNLTRKMDVGMLARTTGDEMKMLDATVDEKEADSDNTPDRKSTRLNSSHSQQSRMPSSA